MILHVRTNVLKAKRGLQWFDLKQFVDVNRIRDFFTMNLELRIRFHELKMKFSNFYEFVHTNFVFVRKTSNLFVRIREGFQHVMLQMACIVDYLRLSIIKKSLSYIHNEVLKSLATFK